MQIIKAKFILTCDSQFKVIKNGAVAFDEKIIAIGSSDEIVARFGGAKICSYPNSILLPAFYNPHVHLEFGSSRLKLVYGNFIKWLNSIVGFKSALSKEQLQSKISKDISDMMRSGVAGFGEISSTGIDLEPCANSQARVVFFTEILGVTPKDNDQKIADFKLKFAKTLEYKSDKLTPSISLHSPYSINKGIAEFACEFARQNSLILSTHFLESKEELIWLESGEGEFKTWLNKFDEFASPPYTPLSYVENFSDIKTLFTHCVFVKDFGIFKPHHHITHCARSNRLLGDEVFDMRAAMDLNMPVNIATDGLSSNISLNMYDELRANLLIHSGVNLHELSKFLLTAATSNGASALGIDGGIIGEGKVADLQLVDCEWDDTDGLGLNLILNTKEVQKLFIGGKECKF